MVPTHTVTQDASERSWKSGQLPRAGDELLPASSTMLAAVQVEAVACGGRCWQQHSAAAACRGDAIIRAAVCHSSNWQPSENRLTGSCIVGSSQAVPRPCPGRAQAAHVGQWLQVQACCSRAVAEIPSFVMS
jgi:hypothetical protein